jgi:hypothetical protein
MTGPRPWLVHRFGVLLLGGVLALAGCTSSGEDDTHQRLRSALLQLSDFPPSWRAFPQSAKAGDLLGDIAVCTGAVEREDPVATVQSSEFRNGQQRITSTAVALKSEGDVSKRANSLGLPNADRCAAQAAQQRVLDLLPGAKITSSDFTVQPGGVNVAINYAGIAHGVVNADVEGKATKVYVDAVFLLGSAFYSDITFVGVNTPVPDAIQHVLTDDVALRAQHT